MSKKETEEVMSLNEEFRRKEHSPEGNVSCVSSIMPSSFSSPKPCRYSHSYLSHAGW